MIYLYTLPTCPICQMVKKKLTMKGLAFEEKSFAQLPKEIDTDRAPVLEVEDSKHPGYPLYLLTPSRINEWIKEA